MNDSIYRKHPKQARPQTQKGAQWLRGAGECTGEWKGWLTGMGFLSGVMKNVLKLVVAMAQSTAL